MAGAGGVNMAQFEEYFQRADSDRDGRISGGEAVAFFQGSNLPKQVLAQIWMHADQNHTGYLSRPEFYNALKLVTVAQSKRDLTPDMVKAALYGPASAKIPAPQINLAAISVPQPNSKVAAPSLQTGASALPSSQNFGIRGQAPSTTTINQQFGRAPSTTGTNQFGLAPSTTGTNQFGLAPSTTSMNQFGLASSTTGTNQFGLAPYTTGTNQFGLVPSTSGMNQQFRPVQPSSTSMNQQFWQVQPSSTSMNRQLGQSQPSSTGTNQQFEQAPLSANINKQFFPSQGNQSIGSHLPMPSGTVPHASQGAVSPNISSGGSMVGPGLSNTNNDWFVGKAGAASAGPTTQVLKEGVSPSNAPSPQDLLSTFSSTAAKDPRGLVGSENGSTLNSMVGGDVLSANQSSSQQVSSALQQPTTSLPTSSAIVPASGPQSSAKLDPFEALQGTLVKPSGGQSLPKPPLPKPNQPVLTQVTSSGSVSGVPSGVGKSVSEQSQISWPKMTRASIQKYAKVFMEVDTDRDGKITGVQARNLFLSWRLPREVLKQVWDLSDQDSDSMLSLREFCIALYLMERYREGHPLPSTLPNNVMLDETLLSLAGPPSAYGSMGWVPSTGSTPQQGLPGAQPSMPSDLRTPMQPILSRADGSMQFNQQNGRGPMIDTSHADQHSNGEENSYGIKGPEATETNEKVDNKEKVLLDSREKLEFYRTKMQDLVLYKSRCDNQLNEITERARADKGEAELLEKKYQEKYKQVAEIHSKLTIEEASFREIQARKMELHQAIIKMEQGGSADGILQVRADRLQSDLEELLKQLTDRCKKHAVQVKSSVLIDLPPGWQPGIPEVATLWDEEWDKFEDEGFSFDVPVAANAKSAPVQREDSSPTHSFSPNSVSNADVMSEGPFTVVTNAFETESVYSADESKSPQGTPGSQTVYESPSQGYSENHFRENSDGDAETHRSFDEPTWGNFDNNDDVDSVWGFSTKDSDHGKNEEKYFFGSKDFGASPETDSPQAESVFNKNSPFNFEDSVPGTPLSRAGNSPPRYSIESRDPFFDNLSRYDSFNVQDHGSSPRQENLSRFDSINSTMGFNHSSAYSFDESDPFGSSGPFKVSSETPKKDYDSRSSF